MKDYPLKVYEGKHPRITVSEEFVKRNKFSLSRSPQEMLDYASKHDGALSFEKELLLYYMPVESSVDWIKEEKKQEHLTTPFKMVDDVYECTQDFLDYMVFGWSKALDERGISASRTIDKCATYMFLLGRDDVEEVLRDRNLYNPYGSPALIKACEMLDIYVPEELIEFSQHKCSR